MILKHRIYYSLKPYTPWRLRMGMRRIMAARLRKAHTATWPINEAAGKPPADWPGWPESRKFAFILTHDVESAAGLAKVRQLAELEIRLGFRSTFNFIPEGPYSVPSDLLAWLVENGFEVGVHDLHHDGKLYSSRESFRSSAQKINRYLKQWKAVGYRSGFMLRNLEWHQDLNILYDASTFDTDPFEPLPDGAGTIFPFFVPPSVSLDNVSSNLTSNLTRSGYIEFPYTLPQDSTLFLLLGETSSEIWRRKVDWIVDKGGMALLNTHPDYMDFGSRDGGPQCFPVERYVEFLKYVADRYRGAYWHALPCEAATWYVKTVLPRNSMSAGRDVVLNHVSDTSLYPMLRGKRAAVLLYSYYPSDPRPRRAAEILAEAGVNVEVICLRENDDEPKHETINGVNVRRLPMGKTRAGKISYFWQYGRFLIASMLVLTRRCIRRRYDLVHVHNMPDILVFAAVAAKLRGARVILDLHDPMPELMTSIYGLKQRHWLVKLLRVMERMSIGFADRVVTVNQACRKIFGNRSCALKKIEVIMNSPDSEIFSFRPVRTLQPVSGKFVIMYHGSIVERHGLDLAVDALATVRNSIPGAELHIYGKRNAFLDHVLARADQLGLTNALRHHGPQDHEGIARAIDACDVGIIPNRRSIFTEINTPTRIFEYLARGKPVIAPNSPGITDYFEPADLIYFELGNVTDLASKIVYVASHPTEVTAIVERGQQVYLNHQWLSESNRFLSLVDDMLNSRPMRCEQPVVARK